MAAEQVKCVHVHTSTSHHTQERPTGYHDGLCIASKTVLQQPGQHRVSVRDVRVLVAVVDSFVG